MATSSITANFYTDDPKAANAIVHALFTVTKPNPKLPTSRPALKRTAAQERSYWRRMDKVMAGCR